YNGVPLTLVASAASGTGGRAEQWSLKAPATGTHDIVVTLNGSAHASCGATSFHGVDQTSPLGTPVVAATGVAGTTASLSITSAPGNVVSDVVAIRSSATVTPLSPQVQQWTVAEGSGTSASRGASSTQAGPSVPGPVTMSWTVPSTLWALVAVDIHGQVFVAPMNTPTSTPTATLSPTNTATPTNTTAPTSTSTSTPTATNTATATGTSTATNTPTDTPTNSPTPV